MLHRLFFACAATLFSLRKLIFFRDPRLSAFKNTLRCNGFLGHVTLYIKCYIKLDALNGKNLRTEDDQMRVIKCLKILPQERPPPSSRRNTTTLKNGLPSFDGIYINKIYIGGQNYE
jgi:hypothetical protein